MSLSGLEVELKTSKGHSSRNSPSIKIGKSVKLMENHTLDTDKLGNNQHSSITTNPSKSFKRRVNVPNESPCPPFPSSPSPSLSSSSSSPIEGKHASPRSKKFFHRKSILDREGLHNGAPPMRGFLAIFWITIFFYAAVSMYQSKSREFLGLPLQLWRVAYSDFEALLVMVVTIYLYAYIALPYQLLQAKGILDSRKRRLLCTTLQYVIQNGPIMMGLFVAKYRGWPHLQTGSLLLYSIATMMKMHSFLSTNGDLDRQFHQDHSKSKKGRLLLTEKCYPNNLNILNYTLFMWYPTLVYELDYPRTEKIRIGYFVEKSAGIVTIFGLFYVVVGHYVHPILETIDDRPALDVLVDLILPCLASILILFFLVFEYMLNWTAELTCFGDREFYSDWWNSRDMAEFSRKWNIPVHRFLQHHIYQDCIDYGFSRFTSRLITFFYSSILHELVMSSVANRLKFWMFSLQMTQIPLIYLSHYTNLSRHEFLANCIWWLLIVLGVPIIIFLYTKDVNLRL